MCRCTEGDKTVVTPWRIKTQLDLKAALNEYKQAKRTEKLRNVMTWRGWKIPVAITYSKSEWPSVTEHVWIRLDFSLCTMIPQILMLDSVAETKLPDTINVANTLYPRICLRISERSRATTNRSLALCADFESCRGIGACTFKSTVLRLVYVRVFNKQRANTCIMC